MFKADRAGAILARRLTKGVVKTGAARECRTTLAIFPGQAAFRIRKITGDDGIRLDPLRWSSLFDLSLEIVGETYDVPLIDCAR